MSNTLSNLRLIESYLEDIRSLIEESERIESLGVESEDNDHDLRKLLSKTTKFLERNDDGDDYDELVEQYDGVLKQVKSIDTKDYEYIRKINAKPLNTKKSVRFNDTIEESQPSSFKPYKDQVIPSPSPSETEELFEGREVEEESDQNSIDSSSNQEMFIQHQQQLLDQDEHLDTLTQSVRRQRMLGMDINEELDGQNILLDDLEAQLDSNDRHLSHGQKRLKHFSERAKENGQWVTIIILTIILILLLIILK